MLKYYDLTLVCALLNQDISNEKTEHIYAIMEEDTEAKELDKCTPEVKSNQLAADSPTYSVARTCPKTLDEDKLRSCPSTSQTKPDLTATAYRCGAVIGEPEEHRQSYKRVQPAGLLRQRSIVVTSSSQRS